MFESMKHSVAIGGTGFEFSMNSLGGCGSLSTNFGLGMSLHVFNQIKVFVSDEKHLQPYLLTPFTLRAFLVCSGSFMPVPSASFAIRESLPVVPRSKPALRSFDFDNKKEYIIIKITSD